MRGSRVRALVSGLVAGLVLLLIGAAPSAAEQPPGPVSGTLTSGATRHITFTAARQHVVLKVYTAQNYERLFLTTSGDQVNLQYTAYASSYDDYRIFARNPAYRSTATIEFLGWSYVDFYPAQPISGSVDVTAYISPRINGGTVESGQTVSAATAQRGQQEAFTFFGTEGQRPTVFATKQSYTDRDAPDAGHRDATTILFVMPQVADGQHPPVPSSHDLGTVTGEHNAYTEGPVLDVTGTWTMLVQGRGPDSIGAATLRFGLVTDPTTVAMASGTPTTVMTTKPGLDAARSIHVGAGQQLALTLSGPELSAESSPVGAATPRVAVTIYEPDGSTGPSAVVGDGAAPITLTDQGAAGTYTAVFDPLDNTIGSVTAQPVVASGTGVAR